MLVNLEITKGEHVCCASPVWMVSGPLGTLRVDVRLTYIPDAGDLGHINPRGAGGVLGRKSPRGKEGGLW